jgi:hypothetical protein
MPVTLARTISKIQSIPNSTNAQLVKEMYEYLKNNGVSERHQHNALKVMIPFANYLGPNTTFFDVNSREQILAFPLLAGPGAITTVIISLQAYGWMVSIISIVFVVILTYLIFHLQNPISRILGRRGSVVTTRVFAIFLAAIAVQYIVEGLRQLFVLQ